MERLKSAKLHGRLAVENAALVAVAPHNKIYQKNKNKGGRTEKGESLLAECSTRANLHAEKCFRSSGDCDWLYGVAQSFYLSH
ncbi:hypothetical protein V6N13_045154 [Hibiscus sabdariffa]|uniref:Uncharacterized protein n=1 Tax=Hibiscus sabdariffa TaxID=183260 RepID=A0ABR2RKC0_9ROSI